MRAVFYIVFWSITTVASAQKIAELTTAQIKEDFDFLKVELEKYNPAMYAYHPKEIFEKRMENIQQSITAPMTAIQYFKLLSWAAEAVNEGHVKIGTEQDEFYKGFFAGEYKSLPLSVECLGEKVFVWLNYSSDSSLQRGDEILSINNHSIADIRQEIFNYTVADAGIETFKQMRFCSELAARYFWFVEQPDSFAIEYKKLGAKRLQKTKLPALTHPEMSQQAAKNKIYDKKPQGIDKFYSLTGDNDRAVLTLRTFDDDVLTEYNIKAYTFYHAVFKRLKKNKTQYLVIDVRDNGGGTKDYGDDLLPFVLPKNRKGIFRELVSWDGKVVPSEFPKRSNFAFKGKLYILVDGGTYSTAAHIAKYLWEFADATIIGEEAGSRYEGFAAGTYHYCILPNSKIKIGIPNQWVKNFISEKQATKNRGLLPEYPVETTIEDKLAGRDKALEKAYELIKIEQENAKKSKK